MRENHNLQPKGTRMIRKDLIDKTISGIWAVTRRSGCLALLIVGFAAHAHADDDKDKDHHHHKGAPEIATGAAITAALLAGGGLLLLADRFRRKQSSTS